MKRTIYLDYAATSAIRPPEVADAVGRYLIENGASPGRAGHARALDAGRMVLQCRTLISRLIGHHGDPGRVTFHLNATHALNAALGGVLRPGDRVIRTTLDHNSVRRPVAALARRGVEEVVLPLGPEGVPNFEHLDELLAGGDRPARLIALPHASNVTGAVLPIAEISDRARLHGTLVLLDAAQTVGHFPVDVGALGVDLLAFSGHKGLGGPQGTGGLWVREGVELEPLVFGGTGGDSGPLEMPSAYPDHLEAGTQNAPGIAGLRAAVERVLAEGVERRHQRESALKQRLLDGLRTCPEVRVLSPDVPESIGIVTLLHDGIPPGELAVTLEKEFGIQSRAGLHCAPGAHEVLGTLQSGAVRLSIGWATTREDVEDTVAAFSALRRLKRGV